MLWYVSHYSSGYFSRWAEPESPKGRQRHEPSPNRIFHPSILLPSGLSPSGGTDHNVGRILPLIIRHRTPRIRRLPFRSLPSVSTSTSQPSGFHSYLNHDDRNFEKGDIHSVEDWAAVLRFSTEWGFESIRSLAIERLAPIATPVDKIVLSRECKVQQWLVPSLTKLCLREEFLSRDESRRLGVDDFYLIASVRERLRANGGDLHEDDVSEEVSQLIPHEPEPEPVPEPSMEEQDREPSPALEPSVAPDDLSAVPPFVPLDEVALAQQGESPESLHEHEVNFSHPTMNGDHANHDEPNGLRVEPSTQGTSEPGQDSASGVRFDTPIATSIDGGESVRAEEPSPTANGHEETQVPPSPPSMPDNFGDYPSAAPAEVKPTEQPPLPPRSVPTTNGSIPLNPFSPQSDKEIERGRAPYPNPPTAAAGINGNGATPRAKPEQPPSTPRTSVAGVPSVLSSVTPEKDTLNRVPTMGKSVSRALSSWGTNGLFGRTASREGSVEPASGRSTPDSAIVSGPEQGKKKRNTRGGKKKGKKSGTTF